MAELTSPTKNSIDASMTSLTEISFTGNLDYELQRLNNDGGFDIVLTHKPTKNTVFRCTASFIENSKNLVSVDVYRSNDYEHSDALRGIADKVIFDHVLKSHAIVINELQQTATGSRIWNCIITRALIENLYVYHVSNDELTRIYDKKQLEMRKSVVISEMPINCVIGTESIEK